jgi:hypothetical protein
MNVIFCTQGKTLDLFFMLALAMRKFADLEKVGFYVADSRYFDAFRKKKPEIESDKYFLLKEWEIVRDSQHIKPDMAFLEEYENKFGNPFLWNALVADRRIYFGKRYAYVQDYQPRFNHERMLSILQLGLKRMDDFFQKVQPDLIVSFQCVTIGEYLSYLFAKAKKIQILNLRPTRIQNYFYAGESVYEPSEHLKEAFKDFFIKGIEDSLKQKALSYLQGVKVNHAMYEGVVPSSNKPFSPPRQKRNFLQPVSSLAGLVIGEYKYRFGEYRHDNHISGFIGPFIGQKIIRPWRAELMKRAFRKIYVNPKDLPQLNYAFFPLHTEPEVTLSVYSKPYLNQIEVARLISHNLPVGMKLVIKEHPWSIGKRPLGYYRKLLKIPNVLLADPRLKSRELIDHSKLVIVIAGSIAFEGMILNKPAIILGHAPFEFLPSSMLRHITDPNMLGNEIHDLMQNYKYNEEALLSYIAAVIDNSVPLDFYSRLIGRPGVYRDNSANIIIDEDKEREVQIYRLSEYLFARYKYFQCLVEQENKNNFQEDPFLQRIKK